MPRVVWKGAISFGLVHVPIVLHPGARNANLDFDWLDRRDMAPVGYQRINKLTGKTIESEHIVKGYQYEKGEYVLMSDEDFRQANPVATQTVEIACFVKIEEVPSYYFDTPYYMVPDRRGEKGYALLRETLRKSQRVGMANVVLHTRQHLAAVMVVEDLLVLNTMRYAEEILPQAGLETPSSDLNAVGVSTREVDMAMRLVEDMTETWQPDQFHDQYREDLLSRIEEKIAAGRTHALTEPSRGTGAKRSAKIIDLTTMLRESIESRAASRPASRARKSAASAPASKSPARKAAAKKTPAKKAASTRKTAAARKTGGRKQAA